MIILTWNISGFTQAKKASVLGLLRTFELVFLTGKWSQVEETAH